MKQQVRHILSAALVPLFILSILYLLKILEVEMEWDFKRLGIYPMSKRGVFGIFAHPLVHTGFRHLTTNTPPLFLLMWCLYYFYQDKASIILFTIWIGCGTITFFIGKPGWHMGSSGLIYALVFFLLASGITHKHKPLVIVALIITILYGGLVWNMLPQFAKATSSWEGHLSGAIAGVIGSLLFRGYKPCSPLPPDKESKESLDATDDKFDTSTIEA